MTELPAPDPAAALPAAAEQPLRVALLSYRSKPHCGGQGIYLRHLSRELAALGHDVEVLSGQPYPDLEPGPVLREVPSLDLYRDEDPFRTPGRGEYRDWIDVLEVAMMWTAAFPEPLTFSLRALRELRRRRGDFDVVHDNQVLGYGMLGIPRLGMPLVTSIHHPISVDRRIELAQASGWERFGKRRWYSFVRMQARVARRVGPILTGSQSSKDDIVRDFRVPPGNVRVIPLGVDTRLFRPATAARVPGSIIAVASADSPVKGVPVLLQAFAKILTEHKAVLTVVGKPAPGGPTERLIGELALRGSVRFVSGITDAELAALVASSEIAVVPSRYEGFSLPAVEHMAAGTPLIATRTGSLPEVVAGAALLVEPGDVEQLAAALRHLLSSPRERERLSKAAVQRVHERFAWSAVAKATVAEYRAAIASRPHNGTPASPGTARPGFRRAARQLSAGAVSFKDNTGRRGGAPHVPATPDRAGRPPTRAPVPSAPAPTGQSPATPAVPAALASGVNGASAPGPGQENGQHGPVPTPSVTVGGGQSGSAGGRKPDAAVPPGGSIRLSFDSTDARPGDSQC